MKEFVDLNTLTKLPIISSEGETSVILKDKDTVIKLFDPMILQLEKTVGLDTEKKVLEAKKYTDLPELNVPTSAIYDVNTRNFIATRSPYLEGRNYNQINSDYFTLIESCNLHIRLEDFLKRCDKHSIVLPDYTSLDNLIFEPNEQGIFNSECNFHFIDYEGVQTIGNKSMSVSSSIMIPLIDTPKYIKNNYFSQELNIFSHYMLFFLDALHADLKTIGTKTPNGIITFDVFFHIIGLYDYDIQQKVWKLFQKNQKNENLGDDLIKLQEEYEVETIGYYNGTNLKRLRRK